jgi:hypothetical protein
MSNTDGITITLADSGLTPQYKVELLNGRIIRHLYVKEHNGDARFGKEFNARVQNLFGYTMYDEYTGTSYCHEFIEQLSE